MSIHTFFKSLTSTPPRRRPIRRRPPASRLWLEPLEDRCLLSFSPAVNYPVGGNPQAVVTGDFNGDGKLDLAVANQNSNTVSILLGKGDGTFQPSQNFATGGGPQSLAVGDFNGDGKLDIVTANYSSNTVSVLLGNGNGTFQAPTNIAIGSHPAAVAVGDFNGDGKLDLGVTTGYCVISYYGGGGCVGGASVLLGHGDGSFSAPSTPEFWGGYHTRAVAEDFNGDGRADFVAVNYDAGLVEVQLANPDGSLGAMRSFPVGYSYPMSVAAADINGDGRVDLVTAGSSSVSVLLGNADGTFQPAQVVSGAGYIFPTSVAVGDFNHDGKIDVVTANSGGVRVLLGNGNGTFQAASNFPGGFNPDSVAVGDFNGDGSPDLAVADAGSWSVSVLLNTGDWSTTPQASSFAVSGFPSSTTAGGAGSFTVTAKNTDGTTATGYAGTVHFTSSDAQAGLPADYTFMAADQGIHTFSAILKTAGTQSITATDTTTGSITGSETGITVNPAAASTMIVAGFPSPTTAGVAGSFTVRLKDPYGNIAGGYTGTVHFTSSDAKASLPANYTFTAADAGVHTFSAILKTAGTQSLTAKDTTTASLTGTDGGITVKPGAASRFLISAPSSVSAGVPFRLTLTVQDAYGNVVTGYTGTVHFKSTDGTATLPANYTFTAVDKGVHTFTGLVLRTKGKQTITITDTLNSSLTGSVIENVL
jgi:hypothetical protein